jgi:hypothetical protein
MEIVNNTETERLRAAINEALNPNDNVWPILDAARNDIIRFQTHGRLFTRENVDGNPALKSLVEEHLKLMEAYFNNAKEIMRVGLKMVDDGWKKQEYLKYLDKEFTSSWNR